MLQYRPYLRHSTTLLLTGVLSLAAGTAAAQDLGQWLPGPGLNGVPVGTVYAVERLPGGDFIIAGIFPAAGKTFANNIVRYNPVTHVWSPLGAGVQGAVYGVAVSPSGKIIAGGDFDVAGDLPAANIASFDPQSGQWSPMGQGTDGDVNSLLALPNGELLVGGQFVHTDHQLSPGVSKYNENSGQWTPIPGLSASRETVYGLSAASNGDILVVGSFILENSPGSSGSFARLNPSTLAWTPTACPFSTAVSVLEASSGIIYVGGLDRLYYFSPATGNWAYRFFGNTGYAHSLAETPDGNLVFGGSDVFEFNPATSALKDLNAAAGSSVNFYALVLNPNSTILAGGDDFSRGLLRLSNSAHGSWKSPPPITPDITAILPLSDTQLVAAGYFSSAGLVEANGIATYNLDADTWNPIGAGVTGRKIGSGYATASTQDIKRTESGKLLIVGDFRFSNGVPVDRIATFDNGLWTAPGLGLNETALTVHPRSGASLIVTGNFTGYSGGSAQYLASWNGVQWSSSATGPNWHIRQSVSLPDGDLICVGTFNAVADLPVGGIVRYRPSTDTWSALVGNPVVSSNAVASLLPDGRLVISATSVAADGLAPTTLATYDTAAGVWAPLSSGITGRAYKMITAPDGDLILAGTIQHAGGPLLKSVARYNLSTGYWSTFGAGITADGITDITGLAFTPGGDLIVSGNMLYAGGQISQNIARWRPGPRPLITGQPTGQTACNDGSATFNAAADQPNISYHWQVEAAPVGSNVWTDLADGPSGLTNISGSSTSALTISNAFTPAAARYRCIAFSPSFSVATDPATLTVCAADRDCSGEVDLADYFQWTSDWDAAAPGAETDGLEGIDLGDFFAFFNALDTGC